MLTKVKPGDTLDLVRGGVPGLDALLAEIERLGTPRLEIVFSIETQAAISRLPMPLLAAMRHPPVAARVARGDVGADCGRSRSSPQRISAVAF